MKKKILYIAIVLICLAIIAGSTLAHFTTSAAARNVITTGSVELAVVEQQLVDGVPQQYEDPKIPVMPGTAVSKIVYAQSSGQAAWVRMSYTLTVYDAYGNKLELPADELAKVIIIEPDSSKWIFKDGWWYYNAAIAAGEMTPPLFEEVVFSGPDMDNKYQNCTVEINVSAQGVQKANNGSDVMDALGWPE